MEHERGVPPIIHSGWTKRDFDKAEAEVKAQQKQREERLAMMMIEIWVQQHFLDLLGLDFLVLIFFLQISEFPMSPQCILMQLS